MKQHLRKLSALLLTLVLAISLAPAALAAPTTVADTTMTFKGVMAGDTVTAYGKLVQKGRVLHVWHIDIKDSAGDLVSTVQVTNYAITPRNK